MNAASHIQAAEDILAHIDIDDPAMAPGEEVAALLTAIAHALIGTAIEIGVPHQSTTTEAG